MRLHRTTNEVLSDELLTLVVLAELQQAMGRAVDRRRFRQLVFLVTAESFQRGWKGFNYRFFWYKRGPCSTGIYQAEEDLTLAGLMIAGADWTYRLTEAGLRLAADVRGALQTGPHAPLWRLIVATVQAEAAFSSNGSIDAANGPRGLRADAAGRLRFGDVPNGADLTRVLEVDEAVLHVELPGELVTRLANLTGTDETSAEGNDPGEVFDADQQWFWSERWQAMEREADAAIAAGRVKRFDDAESFLAELEE